MSVIRGQLHVGSEEFDASRGVPAPIVSFVPQDDPMPKDLTVVQVLTFAARLRLSRDVGAGELNSLIQSLAARLQLSEHLGKDVGSLSGGTTKRLSTAMELVAKPSLLIMDEPTSGLDEGLDRSLMRQLRQLARDGTSILIVTHSMANIEEADALLAMTKEHQSGYFGSPSDFLAAMNVANYADAMETLGKQGAGSVGFPSHTLPVSSSRLVRPRAGKVSGRTGTLLRRAARQIAPWSDSGPRSRRVARCVARPLVYMLGMPLVAALLAFQVGVKGFAIIPVGENAEAPSMASLLALAIAFFAASLTTTSVVNDFDLIRRESRWGCSALDVVSSRFLLFAPISCVQAIVTTSVLLILRKGPESVGWVPGWLGVVVTLCLLGVCSCSVGLWISCVSERAETAVYFLMFFLIGMVAFSGLFLRLGDENGVVGLALWSLGAGFPSRWAIAGLGVLLDFEHVVRDRTDLLWSGGEWKLVGVWLALILLSAGSFVGAVLSLDRRIREKL